MDIIRRPSHHLNTEKTRFDLRRAGINILAAVRPGLHRDAQHGEVGLHMLREPDLVHLQVVVSHAHPDPASPGIVRSSWHGGGLSSSGLLMLRTGPCGPRTRRPAAPALGVRRLSSVGSIRETLEKCPPGFGGRLLRRHARAPSQPVSPGHAVARPSRRGPWFVLFRSGRGGVAERGHRQLPLVPNRKPPSPEKRRASVREGRQPRAGTPRRSHGVQERRARIIAPEELREHRMPLGPGGTI